MRTKGSTNTFRKHDLYILRASLPILNKLCNKNGLVLPQSWSKGGGLNDIAHKFGLVPDWENGVTGVGHREKYTGEKMKQFIDLTIIYLKNPRKIPTVKELIPGFAAPEIAGGRVSLGVASGQLSFSDVMLESCQTVVAGKFDLSNLTTEQLHKLKAELDEKLLNSPPDWKAMKPGDTFEYRGFNWTCLDPEFKAVGGTGCLAIMTKLYEDEFVFSDDDSNNYLESKLRKKMDEIYGDITGENSEVLIAHEIDTIKENGEDAYGSYKGYVFALSIQEYIRHAKYVPRYSNWSWLRSPYPTSARNVRGVYTDGSLNGTSALNAIGVAPACIFNRQI